MADTTTNTAAGSATPGSAGGTLGIDLASILSMFQGLNNTYLNQGQNVANIADPLSSLNSTTLPMLSKLLTDPSSITGTPGYQFAVTQGQDAIKAATNASTGSSDPTRTGSLGPALAKFTEDYALQDYNQQIQNLLGTLPSSPTGAAAALSQGQANQNTSLGQGIAGIAGILTQLGIPTYIANQIAGAMGGGSSGMGTSGTTGGGADPNATLYTGPQPGDITTPPDLTGGETGGFPDLTGGGGYMDFSNLLSLP